MKTDRILELILYLQNHDNVPASLLASRFHVSVRTIQRDIISLSEIGIPVYSLNGKQGGYSILPTYKVRNSTIREEEQQMILKALESLSTTYTNDTLKNLIEKYNALFAATEDQKVFWDFGVTKEDASVQKKNEVLEKAIGDHRFIHFNYRNSRGDQAEYTVEPLAIHYKWYAWYLFTYCEDKSIYKTFKVARIQNIMIENCISHKDHGDIRIRMKESENAYYKTCITIEVSFAPSECTMMQEYFPDCKVQYITDWECRMQIHVPAKERLWKALLLSFGNKVTILSPESYKEELVQTAKEFYTNYDNQLSH